MEYNLNRQESSLNREEISLELEMGSVSFELLITSQEIPAAYVSIITEGMKNNQFSPSFCRSSCAIVLCPFICNITLD
jgi:hypothetical protein